MSSDSRSLVHINGVVVDFDGTLVPRSTEIDEEIVDLIYKIQNKGIHFTISTGRTYYGIIAEYAKKLKLTAPVLTRNGAETFDPQTDTILESYYVDSEAVTFVSSYFESRGIGYVYEESDKYSTVNTEYESSNTYAMKRVGRAEIDMNKIAKIVAITHTEEKADELLEGLREIESIANITKAYSRSKDMRLDITSIKASKHLSLLRWAEHLGISPQEILGVGDGHNDYPLLSACGYRVAMADAPQVLKEIADEIIPSVDEHGLKQLFTRLLQSKS